MSDNHSKQTDPPPVALEAAIDTELAILASIEARYTDELTKLERSVTPPTVKDHLRDQLEAKRKMAREPHVLRLATLHQEVMMGAMFGVKTRH
jgi:hypothetical protein